MNESTCWNCGKTATVPFKPDGKRPVYCLSCLKQIEDGKLIPLPERLPQVGRARYNATLGELGIEFSATEGRASPNTVGRAAPYGSESRPAGRGAGDQGKGVISGVVDSRKVEERGVSRHTDRGRFGRDHMSIENKTFPMERRGPQLEKKPGAIHSQPVVRVSPAIQPLSLSQLKSREASINKNKKEVGDRRSAINTPELRKALEEALAEGNGKLETKPSVKKEQTIQPGETVKF